MRQIKKDYDASPTNYNQRLETLQALYHHKCAYCESDIRHCHEIEHYRPQDGIDIIDNPPANHKGYHWLKYEWSNLLIACPKCNGQNAKGNRFPVQKTHVTAKDIDEAKNRADYLAKIEEPMLLNPELDNPQDHFSFYWDGKPYVLNNSNKGQATIKIIKLDRKNLVVSRTKRIKQHIRFFKKRLPQIIEKIKQIDSIEKYREVLKNDFFDRFDEMNEDALVEETYSYYSAVLLDNFLIFLPDWLKSEMKNEDGLDIEFAIEIVTNAYKYYLKSRP